MHESCHQSSRLRRRGHAARDRRRASGARARRGQPARDRRRASGAGQGRRRHGRRLGPRAGVCRLHGAGARRRGRDRRDLLVAHREELSRRVQARRSRRGRRLPVRQLRGRQHEREDGDQDGRRAGHRREDRRRERRRRVRAARGAREAPRRRGRDPDVEGGRRAGGRGRRSRRRDREREEGDRQHALGRHRPVRVHDPGERQGELPHRRRRDGGRHRPSRRAWRARDAHGEREGHGGDDARHRAAGFPARTRRGSRGAGVGARRDAADGAVHSVCRSIAAARGRWAEDRLSPRRQSVHVARDDGRHADRHPARRQVEATVRRAVQQHRPHRGRTRMNTAAIQCLPLADAGFVVRELVDVIRRNRDHLSEIDAAIGDGDHGINMSKGFGQCGARLDARGATSLPDALDVLSTALMDGIGGSMGPLYGSFFMDFAAPLKGRDTLDAALFGEALAAGFAGVQAISDAKIGDKTLIDTLAPAAAAFHEALRAGDDFRHALAAMSAAAERGKESTRWLQARVGRASRLGERSVGTLDAGAASCCLILCSLASSIGARLN
ncbi:dihydroxyacetone kinase family protein [Burkholderia pseudomallei 1710b]|nr:dihydroxyacetone kinase family protein [Burkholderia pseudomallei 1710b]